MEKERFEGLKTKIKITTRTGGLEEELFSASLRLKSKIYLSGGMIILRLSLHEFTVVAVKHRNKEDPTS